MKALSYNTTMKTARSFANHLKSSKEKFSPRPYNRHKPKDTTWWVVPGTDWPAFSYGKYIFRDQGDKIQAGVNIEKGFGPFSDEIIKTLKLKEKSVVDDGWVWDLFIEDINSENLNINQILNQVLSQSKNLYVVAGISYVNQPGNYDPLSPKSDRLLYKYDNGKLSIQTEKSRINSFPELQKAENIIELIEKITNHNDIDWCWVDIDFLVEFKKKREADDNDEIIDEYKLYNIFRPLERWIR